MSAFDELRRSRQQDKWNARIDRNRRRLRFWSNVCDISTGVLLGVCLALLLYGFWLLS